MFLQEEGEDNRWLPYFLLSLSSNKDVIFGIYPLALILSC